MRGGGGTNWGGNERKGRGTWVVGKKRKEKRKKKEKKMWWEGILRVVKKINK